MRHPDDAIRWIDTDNRLLGLAPEALMQALRLRWAQTCRDFSPCLEGFEAEVESMRNVRPQMDILHAQGPIAFHVDPSFPQFTYILVLCDGGMMVEGGAWDPFAPTPAGALICLDVHRPHGLRLREHDDPAQLQALSLTPLSAPMTQGWAGLAINFWAEVSPELAAAAFIRALVHDEAAIIEQV